MRTTRSLTESDAERLTLLVRDVEPPHVELMRVAFAGPVGATSVAVDGQTNVTFVPSRQGTSRAKLSLESEIRQNADAVAAAEARQTALKRGVALAERAKARAQVRAPFAGRIEMRQVEIGERVKAGDPLFTIVDMSRMEVPIALPAGRYDEVVVGAEAKLYLPEHDEPLWTGVVARKAPAIETERRIFFAYLVVEGSAGENAVTPGAHLVGVVSGRQHEGVIPIPRRAFLTGRLFVAKPGETEGTATVEERTPEVTRYLMGYGLVKDGLDAGEFVLITNLESVAEGSTVRIAPEAEGEEAR